MIAGQCGSQRTLPDTRIQYHHQVPHTHEAISALAAHSVAFARIIYACEMRG